MTFLDIIKSKRADLAELELFADICKRALCQAVKAVDQVEWQVKTAELLEEKSPFSSNDDLAKAKAQAETVAKFAKSQTEGGSPYLYSLCAVRLWALLESLADELVVESLRKPSARSSPRPAPLMRCSRTKATKTAVCTPELTRLRVTI